MDPLIIILAICVAIVIVAIIRRFTVSAGDMGENAVASKLRWLPHNQYFVINDLVFTKSNGNTTQIDHVVVSPYAIFVIETKNIFGYIHGSDNSKLWRSCWRNRDLAFDNPIQQNKAHITALTEKLKLRDNRFVSIIAFSTNANLQVSVNDTYVIYWSQVWQLIRRFKEPIMTIEEAKEIYSIIKSINITDKKSRKEHAVRARINKNSYEVRSQKAVEEGKCPKCGGHLMLRNGKHGAFYGCSNYPNCIYTHLAY
ncbi:MAG: NERD domain-containing protein [Paludibacteraceae bacterium]|nr:NERD domain-containing protein [Paludibacteraceae bacterium]